MVGPGFAELVVVLFGLLFAVVPLAVTIFVVVGIFRRLDRIVAATEATAEAVRRLESTSRPNV